MNIEAKIMKNEGKGIKIKTERKRGQYNFRGINMRWRRRIK